MLIVLLVTVVLVMVVVLFAVGLGRAGAASDRQADEAVSAYEQHRAELREQLRSRGPDEHVA